jgi:uncharacterized protein
MVARFLMRLIRFYQRFISPLFGPVCRFQPTCSHYGFECLRLHGAAKGSYLTVRRILRCHPFHPGGYDPPPLPAGHPGQAAEAAPPSGSDPHIASGM